MSSEKQAVLLDQHLLWLDAVEWVVNKVGVQVVGKATTASGALALLEEHRPDLFIPELRTAEAEMDVSAFLTRVRERAPEAKTIVLSESEDPDYIATALQAGAVAYAVKSVHPDDLGATIRQVFDHSIYLAGAQQAHPPAPRRRAAEPSCLTRREIEILQLVAEGYSNSQLAKMLWVTEQTVKFHLSNIYRKIDVSNRTEASRWAQVRGLLPSMPEAASSA